MEKIVFECEALTPILMYGAKQEIPEIRAASIKGVMRFWWRALHGNLTLSRLKEKESEIFGDTSHKSPFKIKIQKYHFNNKEITKGFKFKIEFLFSKDFSFQLCDFFILVTLLGGFGQSAKWINQGKIKILTITKNDTKMPPDTHSENIDRIYELLKASLTMDNIKSFYRKEKHTIISTKEYTDYPTLHQIKFGNTLEVHMSNKKIFKRRLNG